MPFRSMESGLMGRLGSSRCCCTMLLILSLVSCMVSMAFSRGLISTCGSGRTGMTRAGGQTPPRPAPPRGGPCPCPWHLARGKASRLWPRASYSLCTFPSSGSSGQGLSSPNKRSRACERLYMFPLTRSPHAKSKGTMQGQLVPGACVCTCSSVYMCVHACMCVHVWSSQH